jgi:chemotaxis protein MotB
VSQPPIIVKKVIAGHGGHHGGSWKVAYADFMTSMLALFIVLWVIGQSEKTKAAIAEYFKDPTATPEELKRRINAIEDDAKPIDQSDKPFSDPVLQSLQVKLMHSLKGMTTDDGHKVNVKLEWTDQGLRITLLDKIKAPFFDLGSPKALPYTERVLKTIGHDLASVANPIVIEGHTDHHQYSTPEYGNWELSAERANAARRLLCAGGMNPKRVAEVRGYADTRLLMVKNPLAPENRRVSILVRFRPEEREKPINNLNDLKESQKGEVTDETKADPKPEGKSGADAKGESKANPEGKAGSAPEAKGDAKAEGKGEVKAEGKGEVKAEGKGEVKAESKSEGSADAKAEQPKAEGEAKADAKQESK